MFPLSIRCSGIHDFVVQGYLFPFKLNDHGCVISMINVQ